MTRGHPTDPAKRAKAHTLFIRLCLPPYTVHFKSPTYLQPSTLDLLDQKVCKETLRSTAQNQSVREAIGVDPKFWAELVELLRAAVPSLERRSFDVNWAQDGGADYEPTTGATIAGNYPGLWRDIERLNDVVSISRNVLTVGETAQDLAAQHGTDIEVFRLVNVCVRVTARGFDGEAGNGDEEKWQAVVNAYKKTLITSLQWMNNLVAQNEPLKLRLWAHLFEPNTALSDSLAQDLEDQRQRQLQLQELQRQQPPAPPEPKPEQPTNTNDLLLAYTTTGPSQRLSPLELEAAQPINATEGFKPLPTQARHAASKKLYGPNAWVYFVRCYKSKCIEDFHKAHARSPMLGEIAKNMPRYWWLEEERMRREGKISKQEMEKEGGMGMWEIWGEEFAQAEEDYLAMVEAWGDEKVERAEAAKKARLKQITAAAKPTAPKREGERGQEKVDIDWVDFSPVEAKIKAVQQQLRASFAPAATVANTTATADSNTDPNAPAAPSAPAAAAGALDLEDAHNNNYNPLSLPTVEIRELQEGQPEESKAFLQMSGFTAEAGRKILEAGKVELGRRLEGYADADAKDGEVGGEEGQLEKVGLMPSLSKERRRRSDGGNIAEGSEVVRRQRSLDLDDDGFAEDDDELEDDDDSANDSDSDADDEDEDYPGSTEDGRGLLTDVPLILGPSEIEVLPMLILSGLVIPPPPPSKPWLGDPFTMPPRHVQVLPHETHEGREVLKKLHVLRTYTLLSQTSGRNLLRELLIFVAAWDLREEELYYKFMTKILEAILRAGLMPFAYWVFRDRSRSKDIISPAQAVIMKLLTSIFRSRAQTAKEDILAAVTNEPNRSVACTSPPGPNGQHVSATGIPWASYLAVRVHAPFKSDLLLLRFVFTEFRQHIIPQTCALIFLQGQVRRGRARREDFPLNLWDMERMYEGVYQFLEFFATLAEEQVSAKDVKGYGPGSVLGEGEGGEWNVRDMKSLVSWKKVLAEWEMAAELVTLLRELEMGIPKVGATAAAAVAVAVAGVQQEQGQGKKAARSEQNFLDSQPVNLKKGASEQEQNYLDFMQKKFSAVNAGDLREGNAHASTAQPVAVERPFDLEEGEGEDLPPQHPRPQMQDAPQRPIFEAETPLAYPEDATPVLGGGGGTAATGHHHHAASGDVVEDQDEPSDFEWRNLKKLTVLVLSSLIWKSKLVQDQVRECGGLEALVACCAPDKNNPYIREHAVMCLRFAVEGNELNRAFVANMAQQEKFCVGVGGGVGVPTEVLDERGYETFMDLKGQVGLRRKEDGRDAESARPAGLPPPPPPPPSGLPPAMPIPTSSGTAGTVGMGGTASTSFGGKVGKMTAEKAAELMQNALRDLPLGDKLVTDRQKAEALARLDRAFESTEKALGRGGGGGSGEKKG